jgi:hypothetical protein
VSSERAPIQPRPVQLGLGDALEGIGLNLAGVLPIPVYDRAVPTEWTAERLLPTARSAILLAAGGDALFRQHRAAGTSRSLDDFVQQAVDHACSQLRQRGWQSCGFAYDEKRGDQYVDLIELGVLAGLGGHSRLGLLLHREYGPWLSLRALILTEQGSADWSPVDPFEPCKDCPAPCSAACPVAAPRALPAGFDTAACGGQRALPGRCQSHCDARRVCVIGTEHAYGREAERSFLAASLSEITATQGREPR